MKDRAKLYLIISWGLGLIGALFLAVSIIVYRNSMYAQSLSQEPQHWGVFGDYVGGLAGTLIGLLTLIALAMTLRLQATELADAHDQMKAQAESLREQNDLSFYFELMRERRELIAEWAAPAHGTSARNALAQFVENLRTTVFGRAQVAPEAVKWFAANAALIDPLISVHLELLRLIEELAEKRSDKRALANRLSNNYANTLSAPETGLLFYRGLTMTSDQELRRLMETHAVFREQKNPDALARFINYEHLNMYDARIYGRDERWPLH